MSQNVELSQPQLFFHSCNAWIWQPTPITRSRFIPDCSTAQTVRWECWLIHRAARISSGYGAMIGMGWKRSDLVFWTQTTPSTMPRLSISMAMVQQFRPLRPGIGSVFTGCHHLINAKVQLIWIIQIAAAIVSVLPVQQSVDLWRRFFNVMDVVGIAQTALLQSSLAGRLRRF